MAAGPDVSRDPIAIAQLPPEAGLVADEGMAVPAFLCIFLCELDVAGAMVLAPDAPETVSVEPLAFGLLIPVPPCPPAAPPPAPCAKTLPDIPTKSTESKTPFVTTRMAISSSMNRLTPHGVNPYFRGRNSRTAPAAQFATAHGFGLFTSMLAPPNRQVDSAIAGFAPSWKEVVLYQQG